MMLSKVQPEADMNEKAIPNLLPCPFCGQPPSIEMTRGNGRVVYCASDDCMGPHTAAANLEDATLQWNKRALPPLRARGEIAAMIGSAIEALEANSTSAPVVEILKAANAALSRTAGQEWRDISTRPDGDEPCWIAHAPSETRVVGYPARGLPKGVWRLMWTAKILSWTPTHWMPLPAPPVAEPPTEQAPGHTDLMVSPESIDAFMEANPLPDEPIVAEKRQS